MRNRKRQREARKRNKANRYSGYVSMRNSEGYTDMTAAAAINNVMRKK